MFLRREIWCRDSPPNVNVPNDIQPKDYGYASGAKCYKTFGGNSLPMFKNISVCAYQGTML
jgi:hypothetical protein